MNPKRTFRWDERFRAIEARERSEADRRRREAELANQQRAQKRAPRGWERVT